MPRLFALGVAIKVFLCGSPGANTSLSPQHFLSLHFWLAFAHRLSAEAGQSLTLDRSHKGLFGRALCRSQGWPL